MIACSLMLVNLEDCKESGTAPFVPGELETLIPLNVGAQWKYRQVNYYTTPPFSDTVNVTKRILNQITNSSLIYYTIVESTQTSLSGSFSEAVTDNEYIWYPAGNLLLPKILLKKPIEVGTQWFVNGRDTIGGVLKIIQTDATVNLFGRTFENAILVEANPSSIFQKQEFFIVPKVGIVLENGKVGLGGYVRELVSTNF